MSTWNNLLSKLLAVSNPTFSISKAYNLHRFFFSYDETNYFYYFKKYRLISKGVLLKKVRIWIMVTEFFGSEWYLL